MGAVPVILLEIQQQDGGVSYASGKDCHTAA
jgi:hypothetical protein